MIYQKLTYHKIMNDYLIIHKFAKQCYQSAVCVLEPAICLYLIWTVLWVLYFETTSVWKRGPSLNFEILSFLQGLYSHQLELAWPNRYTLCKKYTIGPKKFGNKNAIKTEIVRKKYPPHFLKEIFRKLSIFLKIWY